MKKVILFSLFITIVYGTAFSQYNVQAEQVQELRDIMMEM